MAMTVHDPGPQRERWTAARALLAAHRDCARHAVRAGPLGRVLLKWAKLRLLCWNTLCGTDIPWSARIGSRLQLPHPNGVVFHRTAKVGDDCMIMQQVTLGQVAKGGGPRLGNRVYVGAGAKVLGEVTIGDGAAIGANAVVLQDVPAGATAVGVPARVIAKPVAEAPLRATAG